MGKYTGAKSNFVKEKIKQTRYEDREYVDKLLLFERSITQDFENLNSAGAVYFEQVQKEYLSEFEEIFKELNPGGYLAYKERVRRCEEKKKKYAEKIYGERKRIEDSLREDWFAAGGLD